MNIFKNNLAKWKITHKIIKPYSVMVASNPPSSLLSKPLIDDGVVRNLFMSFAVVSEKNKVPVLTKTQIFNLLNSVGVETSGDFLDKMMLQLDHSKKGELSFEGFRENYKHILQNGNFKFDHKRLFNLLDKKKVGFFTVEDLTGTLTTSGKITEREAHGIIHSVDANEDKRIDYSEFSKMMQLNPIFCWKLLSVFRVIFVTGGPASGKGTICKLLAQRAPQKILHISSGDLLRDEINSGSILGQSIAETMKLGQLCDARVVITLLKKILYRSPGLLVLLDGFPRSLENARDFVEHFGMGECCILFDCPKDVMIERILERGKNSGRLDDNLETAHKRILTFETQSKEPLAYFQSLGSKVITVDTMLPIEENLEKLLKLEIFSFTDHKDEEHTFTSANE